MSQSRHTSPNLRTQFCSVDDAVNACDPNDYFAVTRVVQQLEILHRQLERDQPGEVATLVDLARRVSEILGSDGALSAEATLEVVEVIVGIVRSSLGLDSDDDEQPEPRPAQAQAQGEPQPAFPQPTAATTRGPGLQLVANKRLGEMLIQMSMLSQRQVEAALAQQRATGCRFGDALVQMRILTREAVESALRMQRTRRPSDDNPWRAR